MEPNENMEGMESIPEAEDFQETGLAEETDGAEDLDSMLEETDDTEDTGEDAEPQGTGGRREPGYVQSRIQKAVARERASMQAEFDRQLAEIRDDFDRQMAPYREQMMEMQARELLQSGKVKDLETARELVRYRQGQAQPEPDEPERDEQGRFTASVDRDPATQARIDMLSHQADRIKAQTGVDVIAEFQGNEDTKMKVVSGEWDFYDVADMLTERSRRKRAPAPMRSPNGASGSEKSTIANMTDEQFERLERKIRDEGARYRIR